MSFRRFSIGLLSVVFFLAAVASDTKAQQRCTQLSIAGLWDAYITLGSREGDLFLWLWCLIRLAPDGTIAAEFQCTGRLA